MNQKYRKRLLCAVVIGIMLAAGLFWVTGTFERKALDQQPALPATTEFQAVAAETQTAAPTAGDPVWPVVLVDGAAWDSAAAAELTPGLWVTVALDGKLLLDLPFDQPHTITIRQEDGSENVVQITGDRVYMESSNCDGHDCVMMGEVTRDNLELRVLGGFIICLPHRLSVEVWEKTV